MQSTEVAQELPEPSAETVLWRVSIECFLACVSRKRGEKFLRLMAEKLANEESLSMVVEIRPHMQRTARDQARREAMALFKQLLPVFLARLR